ncbi:MAG: prephenate dehydrogenase [Bacteroidales bacterium]|nr:prephenate dehydrogenase [Bacteroidales bacterium]
MKKDRFLIVGLGLIGGSYAQGLKRAGYEVGAISRAAETVRYALEQGFVDSARTDVDADYVGGFDIVVFALYPHVMLDWIDRYQAFFKPGTLLTDVTGVKGTVVRQVQAKLRPGVEFVGAHPMAGRECSGIRAADYRIFSGANYIVTPTAANTPAAIARCEEIGRILGFKTISTLSPEAHDEMIGFLSQLTHVIAVALMTCKDTTHLSAYTGDSFRDLTRIARINDEMWSELFLLNREQLLSQIDLFTNQMTAIRQALSDGDTEALRALMRLSTERRGGFDKTREP